MTIEGAILARAVAHSGLNTLIAGRMYALILPQTPTLPAVVFTRIGEQFEHASGADAPTRHALFQFSSWATTYEAARDLADQVRSAFSRFRGTLASTVIEDCLVENELDLSDDVVKDYHIATDITLHYEA